MIRRKVLSQNFKALQAELHLLKVEKLDAYIRPLFANPVIITYVCSYYRIYYIATHIVAVIFPNSCWLNISVFSWLGTYVQLMMV